MDFCTNPEYNILNVYWGTKCLEKEAVKECETHTLYPIFSASFVVYKINKRDTMHTFPSLCINLLQCVRSTLRIVEW
jgi:hypothetical protein